MCQSLKHHLGFPMGLSDPHLFIPNLHSFSNLFKYHEHMQLNLNGLREL